MKQKGVFESSVPRHSFFDNHYYFSCSISLPDAGKSCSKSEECLGGCSYDGLLKNLPKGCNEVIVKSQSNLIEDNKKIVCSEMLVGKCTKEKMIPCSYWYEVDGNEIVSHFQACFMD